ncbi:bestrophin family protein [Flavilitoribacter nigricans]|uniref:Hydrogenase n=1 Tax=Flavilitoribacter nigricans (strain ATCC 23147 / DSM 23189 / NBRC 102662 / NCIMB 1420 / SS-2) TaxID=1122177 RepID=A0A2D0N297_FLAN2|nr:bestrophin family ion channel [Flavilitoribacter nigricans]PHN02577.1 hydrogenase [Flavilitoribacter nigricans DSM 23189 = NBRC 102662]
MVVKKNFHPLKVWAYIKNQVLFVLIWSFVVWLLFHFTQEKALALNFTPIGILGSALAIFVAFRNNSSYGRWWEARTLWGGIVNSSRVFARLVITFTDSHSHRENYDKNRSEAFKKSLVYKQIAWTHAMRLHLRQQNSWEEIEAFLDKEEYELIKSKNHKPNAIQLLIGQQIYDAMANGTLGGFDSFQMEGQLLALTNYQGGAERIKNTPLPRQYDYFTRVFVILFALLLPFGLLGFFTSDILIQLSWLIIPLSVLIAGVFIIMERTGAANEDPFENKITDVALTSICNTIERNLRELLGETDLPEKTQPVNGYLF